MVSKKHKRTLRANNMKVIRRYRELDKSKNRCRHEDTQTQKHRDTNKDSVVKSYVQNNLEVLEINK